jgi:hypothetical protein
MDNLSAIEEHTALLGLGDPIPAWFKAGFPERYPAGGSGSSPAPSIYSWQSFVPSATQQGTDITDPSSPEFTAGMGPVSSPTSTAAAKNIVSNSAVMTTPQAGTVAADPRRLSIADVVRTLVGVAAAGVTEVERQRLAATLVKAQKNQQPVYLPPQVIRQSQTPWGWIAGAGAVLAIGAVLYFVLRKKS